MPFWWLEVGFRLVPKADCLVERLWALMGLTLIPPPCFLIIALVAPIDVELSSRRFKICSPLSCSSNSSHITSNAGSVLLPPFAVWVAFSNPQMEQSGGSSLSFQPRSVVALSPPGPQEHLPGFSVFSSNALWASFQPQHPTARYHCSVDS